MLCKDIPQVDQMVKIFYQRKSYWEITSYHDLVKANQKGFMGRRELLNLAKRNNKGLQALDANNLERLIHQTKKVKK